MDINQWISINGYINGYIDIDFYYWMHLKIYQAVSSLHVWLCHNIHFIISEYPISLLLLLLLLSLLSVNPSVDTIWQHIVPTLFSVCFLLNQCLIYHIYVMVSGVIQWRNNMNITGFIYIGYALHFFVGRTQSIEDTGNS